MHQYSSSARGERLSGPHTTGLPPSPVNTICNICPALYASSGKLEDSSFFGELQVGRKVEKCATGSGRVCLQARCFPTLYTVHFYEAIEVYRNLVW